MIKDVLWNKIHLTSKNELLATCPDCQKTKLEFLKYTEVITEEGKEMERIRYSYGIEHNFVGILKCGNQKCLRIINVSGIAQKDIEVTGRDKNNEYYEYDLDTFRPQHFSPNLRYFKIHPEIPKHIVETIDLAFHHYFYDFNASANKVRTVIELILDDIKAPKKRQNSRKTKMVEINTLHDRIEHFSKRNKFIGTLMLANKYIGNEGSHKGEVEKEELLSSFDNLEEIIDKIYVKNSDKLLTKANQIISEKRR